MKNVTDLMQMKLLTGIAEGVYIFRIQMVNRAQIW